MSLPAQQARARAGHALLMLLSRHAAMDASPIGRVLRRRGVSVLDRGAGDRRPGAFRGVRLLPGDALAAATEDLCLELAQGLLREPPYAMRWMRLHEAQVRLLTGDKQMATAPSLGALQALAAPAMGRHPPAVW